MHIQLTMSTFGSVSLSLYFFYQFGVHSLWFVVVCHVRFCDSTKLISHSQLIHKCKFCKARCFCWFKIPFILLHFVSILPVNDILANMNAAKFQQHFEQSEYFGGKKISKFNFMRNVPFLDAPNFILMLEIAPKLIEKFQRHFIFWHETFLLAYFNPTWRHI